MRRLMQPSLLVLLILLATPVVAQTTEVSVSPTDSVWTQQHMTLEAHLGASTPYGIAALALDFSPFSWISLNVGGGAGLDGAQVGGMVRLRIPIGPFAPTLSGGTSFGSFKEYGGFFHHVQRSVDWAMWINGDLGLEYRWSNGARLRAYGGMAQTQRAVDCRVEDGGYGSGACDGRGIEKVYGGLALGYAF